MKGSDTSKMRLLTIFNYSDSLKLRKKCTDVKPDTNDIALMRLIDRMLVTVKDPANAGVGIAAPQVGINRNIIWVQRRDKVGYPFEVFLNVKIVLYSNKKINFAGDGCLSIPGIHGTSSRYTAVAIEYDKIDGTHHQELVEGYAASTNFAAIIFQHEIDHLNGILFIDRLI
ncbi:MAG: peptide deformylase [Bacteroidetes bacterium]|nr:peptide deformylase [Bacteroidota bacterium]